MRIQKNYTILLIGLLLYSCKLPVSPTGKWKLTQLRTKDDDSSPILIVNLSDSQSIKHYIDTVFMEGDFGKLKLDTGTEAIRAVREMALNFSGLQSTYLTLHSDSTYVLDNQPMLFGFVTGGDSIYKSSIINKWMYVENEKWLSLKLAAGDSRSFRIVLLTRDSMIIDDDMRSLSGAPIKELTMIRQ